MTQARMRLIFGGLLTMVALASLARGDDKPRAPELLPAPRCASCDKVADCCVPGAASCEEGRDCCTKPSTSLGLLSVGRGLKAAEFKGTWVSLIRTDECTGDCCSRNTVATADSCQMPGFK